MPDNEYNVPVVADFSKIPYEQYEKDYINTYYPNGIEMYDESFQAKIFQWIHDTYDSIVLPSISTPGSCGHDIRSTMDAPVFPGTNVVILTGIRAKIKLGWALFIFPRSGLGFKYNIRLVNTCGVIDSDYYYANNCGHIILKLYNGTPVDKMESSKVTINKGDKIAQGVFLPYGIASNVDMASLPNRTGGFGSTGK